MPIHMITMPTWGLSMEQGQVNGWLKAAGDKVARGDEVLDVETDKISSGVECAFDGTLCRQIAQEGETLPVGALLGVVADADTADTADTADADFDAAVAAFQRDFVLAEAAGTLLTKSGLMVGLGETDSELLDTMRDIRAHHVDVLTIGQYLAPSRNHMPVRRYVPTATFDALRDEGLKLGFAEVVAGPLVRSSYHAGEVADRI